ncbi:MAG: NAD(P)-binding protein, partial [Pricia sp.]|nr:NAD(P)-binding protein [Pricia sp.]
MEENKRRDFLKNTIRAGVGIPLLGMTETDAEEVKKPRPFELKKAANPKKVIVGGAGIGGLCCAYELMKLGHDVTVFEASGRHGGHVFTVQDELSDGLYGDGGQEHITKPGYE